MSFHRDVDFCAYTPVSPYKMHVFSKFKTPVISNRYENQWYKFWLDICNTFETTADLPTHTPKSVDFGSLQ